MPYRYTPRYVQGLNAVMAFHDATAVRDILNLYVSQKWAI